MLRKTINKIRDALHFVFNMDNIVRINVALETERKIRILHLQNRNLSSTETGVTDEKYFAADVIVSLTSYGGRIHDVYLAIESLMQQTVKPNKIILSLAENEFSLENIPQALKNLHKRGLTINFCEDIKSYKKLIPVLKKYPDDIIITTDDDVIYQHDFVENLLYSYRNNPELIHFCRGHRITFKNDKKLENYGKWEMRIKDNEVNKLNFPTGVGGVLYPPKVLYKDVTDEKKFMSLAPFADDVWFKAMSLLQGTLSKKSFTRSSSGEDYIEMNGEIQNETALWKSNNTQNKNDEQIKAVFEAYDIFQLLKT